MVIGAIGLHRHAYIGEREVDEVTLDVILALRNGLHGDVDIG